MAKLNPPVPPDKLEEGHIWRDWFTQISSLILPAKYENKIKDVADATTLIMPLTTVGWQNTNKYAIDILVQGGTVTKIEIGRGDLLASPPVQTPTYLDIGLTAGLINLSPQDWIKVTYSSAPTQYKQIPR
jgi:hypothetical protein